MKKMLIFFLAGALVAAAAGVADASWLIDLKKFHASAHGQTPCLECHENIAEKDLHPDPANVTRKMMDFFDVDQCLLCHDEVMEDLNTGIHSGKKIKASETYEDCLRCHHPHYQLRLGENRIGKFEPLIPVYEQCGACHKPLTTVPEFSPDDEACLTCHGIWSPEDVTNKEKIDSLCFYCHGSKETQVRAFQGGSIALIDSTVFGSTPHAEIGCMSCHPQGARFNHQIQKPGDCRDCHPPHDEKITHDAHIRVACRTCHLKSIIPVRDVESKMIRWEKTGQPEEISSIHQMVDTKGNQFCRRCHFNKNPLGAVSMILPPKSILCMPCHAATFSIGDTTTMLSLIVFLAGILMTVSVWVSNSPISEPVTTVFSRLHGRLGRATRAIFSRHAVLTLKTLFFDIFLQRRLYRRSTLRWTIHSLIFFPFVFRSIWGIAALLASIWIPSWPLAWSMLDKNNAITAFLFDLSGVMLLVGVGWAFMRKGAMDSQKLRGLPGQDRLALTLIGGLVLIGFIVTGLRIAMTGYPVHSGYAFVGYIFGRLFFGMTGLTEIYGYFWYAHAVLAGIFIAYLPFSRLKHIIMAPVVLAIHAAIHQNPHLSANKG